MSYADKISRKINADSLHPTFSIDFSSDLHRSRKIGTCMKRLTISVAGLCYKKYLNNTVCSKEVNAIQWIALITIHQTKLPIRALMNCVYLDNRCYHVHSKWVNIQRGHGAKMLPFLFFYCLFMYCQCQS